MQRAFLPVDNATVTVAVTTTSARGEVKKRPVGEYQLRLHNALSELIFYRIGDDSVAATSADVPLPAGAIEVITVENAESEPDTHIAFISASGAGAAYATTGFGI